MGQVHAEGFCSSIWWLRFLIGRIIKLVTFDGLMLHFFYGGQGVTFSVTIALLAIGRQRDGTQ